MRRGGGGSEGGGTKKVTVRVKERWRGEEGKRMEREDGKGRL